MRTMKPWPFKSLLVKMMAKNSKEDSVTYMLLTNQGIIICNNRLIHADIIKLYVYNNILWFYYRLLKIQTILLNGEQI